MQNMQLVTLYTTVIFSFVFLLQNIWLKAIMYSFGFSRKSQKSWLVNLYQNSLWNNINCLVYSLALEMAENLENKALEMLKQAKFSNSGGFRQYIGVLYFIQMLLRMYYQVAMAKNYTSQKKRCCTHIVQLSYVQRSTIDQAKMPNLNSMTTFFNLFLYYQ